MKIKIALFFCLIFSIIGCNPKIEPEEPEEDKTPVLEQTIYHGVDAGKDIKLPGKYLETVEWISYNPFCATAAGNKLTTKHLGVAMMASKIEYPTYRLALWVLVNPRYDDYDLPFLAHPSGQTKFDLFWPEDGVSLWGSSPTSIAGYETKHTKDRRSTNSLQVYITGNVKSPYVCYFFENSKMTSAATLIDPKYTTNLADFLDERYRVTSIDLKNYSAYFEHASGQFETINYVGGISYSYDLGGILLAFMPYTGTKSGCEQNLKEVFLKMETELSSILVR